MLIISIVLYFGMTLAIGFIANKRISNTRDFLNTGRNLHPLVNTAAFFALWFGSETVFGASSEFASKGFLGVIEDPFGGVLCLLLVGLFYAKKLYRLNILTIGDLFRKHYGRGTELVSSILMIFSFFGYAGAQIVALGLILQTVLGISLVAGMLISAGTVVIYTYVGGMWAVSLTDFVQSILIVTGLLCIVVYITGQAGSMMLILESIPEDHKQFFPDRNGVEWANWIGAWMALGFGSIASQDVFQRVNSARSESSACYSTLGGAILYLVFSMVPLYLIVGINVIQPELLTGDLQLALPTMVLHHIPSGLQILFFGSLFSAIMSTCSGALLAPASILSENIIKQRFYHQLSPPQALLITRICVLVVGMVSFIVALSSQNIFHLVAQASIIGLVTIFVPFTASLFFNHKSVRGAVVSMACGTFTWLVFEFVFPLPVVAHLPAFLAAIAGLIAGSYLDFRMR
ncbi:MAG TPA: sodium:solute symporter family protein [Saprospiraceae bacterium]|nr:sodium:solute symporter family protein [Saprospiraceae bacterium]